MSNFFYLVFFHILFLFLPISGFSLFIFGDGSLGINVGYQNEQVNWSYSQKDILDPNAISENFPSIQFVQFGPHLEWLSSNILFIEADYQYGYGIDSDAETQMRILAKNNNGNISERIFGDFQYTAHVQKSSASGTLGYPIRLGPLCFIPILGYRYDQQMFERKNLSANQFSSVNVLATFNPTDFLKNTYYSPYVGLELRLSPIPGGRIKFSGRYQLQLGNLKTESAYSYFTDVVNSTPFSETIFRIKQNVFAEKFFYGHRFNLSLWIGLKKYLTTKLTFHYAYLEAGSTTSDQTLNGTEGVSTTPNQFTTTNIASNLKRPFNGLSQQEMGGEIFLGYSF